MQLNIYIVSLIRPTGLLTLGERYEGYFGKVVDSFEANTGSKYELYNPKEMSIRHNLYIRTVRS